MFGDSMHAKIVKKLQDSRILRSIFFAWEKGDNPHIVNSLRFLFFVETEIPGKFGQNSQAIGVIPARKDLCCFFLFCIELWKVKENRNQNPRKVSNTNRAIRISHRVPTHEVGLRPKTRFTTSGPPVISQQISAKRVPLFYGIKYYHVNVWSNSEPNPHPRKTISSFVSAENGRTCKRDRLKIY